MPAFQVLETGGVVEEEITERILHSQNFFDSRSGAEGYAVGLSRGQGYWFAIQPADFASLAQLV